MDRLHWSSRRSALACVWQTLLRTTPTIGSMAEEPLEDSTEALATQTSKRTAGFLAESLLHEDPRYLPAPEAANAGSRIIHAVAFSFVDRTDSGGHTLAFSNFASATAGGFVGMAYLPPGFNDASHAGQRVGTEFLDIVIANVAREFAPQWTPLARKLHIPKIVPAWWVPERPQHP